MRYKPFLIALFVLGSLFTKPLLSQEIVPFSSNEGWYYYNATHNEKASVVYDSITPFHSGISLAKTNGLWGAVNLAIETIIPFKYSNIQYLNTFLIKAETNGGIHLYNTSVKQLTTDHFQELETAGTTNGLIVFSNEDQNYGILDSTGNILIPAIHKNPPTFLTPRLISFSKSTKKGFKTGVYNSKGKQVLPFEFQSIKLTHGRELECIDLKSNLCLFDTLGQLIVRGEFKEISNRKAYFTITKKGENENLVYLNGTTKPQCVLEEYDYRIDDYVTGIHQNQGVIVDKKGNVTRIQDVSSISNVHHGFVQVSKANDTTLRLYEIDTKKYCADLPFDKILDWNSSYVIGKKDDAWGLAEITSGKILMPLKYRHIILLDNDYLFVKENDSYAMLNPKLEKVSEINFWQLRSYQRDLQCYQVEAQGSERNRFGLISNKGEVILPQAYNEIKLLNDRYGNHPWANHYSYRTYDGNYQAGVISSDGKKPFPFGKYSYISYYGNGFVKISIHEKHFLATRYLEGVADTTGRVIIEPQFDQVSEITEQGITVVHNGRTGFYNLQGKEILAPIYQGIKFFGPTTLLVSKWSRKGIFSLAGEQLVPFAYDEIEYNINDYSLYLVQLDGKQFYVSKNGIAYRN